MRLDRSGVRLSTLDLYEQTPVLLSGHDGGAWHAAGLRAVEQGVPLDCYRVGRGAEYDLVLIRPDGFVAWRARTSGTDPEGTLTDVLDTVLSRR